MTETTALVPTTGEWNTMRDIAKAFHASGFWPDLKTEAQAIAKMLAGREYGYGPFEAMQAIAIVQGRPTLTAQATAARVKASGKYDYRVKQHSREKCEVEFFQEGKSIGTADFSIADAKAANLAGKGNWTSYPEAMLFARALTKGARMYCPDVFGATPAYTAEELGADVDDSGRVWPEPQSDPSEPKDLPLGQTMCHDCGNPIIGKQVGKTFHRPADILERSMARFGIALCYDCAIEASKVEQEVEEVEEEQAKF